VGVARQPLLDGLRFINTGVIHDDREARHPRSRVRGVQHRQAVTKHPRVFAWPEAIEHLARSHRSQMERPRQSVLRVLAWCHPLCLRPLWHPGRSALRQEVASACLRTPHHRMRVPVGVMPPPPDQTVDPVRVVILGDPRGPLPPPAHRVEPASHRVRRHRAAVFGLERGRACGPTPPGAAPAVRMRGGFA